MASAKSKKSTKTGRPKDKPKARAEEATPPIKNFAFIIGGMQCGSPLLFDLLGQHPEIAACSQTEPHFFSSDENWAKGAPWYYDLWEHDPRVHKYALEATTHYSKDVAHPGVPERMAELGANYKILYLLRHPIDRVEAHVASTVEGGSVDPDEYRRSFPYAARLSSYAAQLDCYREVFPNMEFALLDSSLLEDDPAALLRQCVEFLGVNPDFEFTLPEAKEVEEKEGDTKEETFHLEPTERQEIAAMVLEDIERLDDEYGFDSSIWYDRDFRKAAWQKDAQRRVERKLHDQALAAKNNEMPDIFIFPVIDWHFRIQRPQHLAMSLADAGHRVFYFTTTFSSWPGHPGFDLVESPAKNIFICRLHCQPPHPRIYSCRKDAELALNLTRGLDALRQRLESENSIEIVQHPFWRQVTALSPGARVIYDCMDNHGEFSTASQALAEEEDALLLESDVVVTSSLELSKLVAKKRHNTVIRNAADVEHFSRRPQKRALKKTRPIVGYFGAISAWFDSSLMAEAARRFPEWDFVLIGEKFEADTAELGSLENVRFEGEVPYQTLPAYLHAFDVCVIPFRIDDLIRCTNPVKVYEYLSAGKPVVATPMPELMLLGDLVRIGHDANEFAEQLGRAMEEASDEALAAKRSRWAAGQTWASRGNQFKTVIDESVPRVSVVVLCFNNLEMTRACLQSLEQFSNYPNLEVIVVDNASTDGTAEFLEEYGERRTELPFAELKLISNDRNLGFASGNNVGIWQSTGDFVVLLNNDTFVTRGWVADLIRHFRLRPGLGLVGPVTNMIGNEAKIPIEYNTMDEMAIQARNYTLQRGHMRLEVANLGFFCVAISREVIEEIGLLEEDFQVGFFEDDDYCRRAKQAGFHIAIAEDVFIHHHLSASFDALGKERRDEIFEANKKVYEKKWGEWEPHKKRSDFPTPS
ncbi:MAG: glycosyltransferase [Myxococcota bacterium]|nr:glycosyltransferase [Myxococcota bacterium]